jgi:hypothetical protein
MPEFSDYVEVEAEIEVSVDDFLTACSPRELKELIIALVEDGHISSTSILASDTKMGWMEEDHRMFCDRIANSYHRMSNEELDLINKLGDKYNV